MQILVYREKVGVKKTEYAKETKGTMPGEQKVILSRTKGFCVYCLENKRVGMAV